eukprot:COSAG06_NODE_1693_length_8701_cov_80.626133_7_plen_76_part_00
MRCVAAAVAVVAAVAAAVAVAAVVVVVCTSQSFEEGDEGWDAEGGSTIAVEAGASTVTQRTNYYDIPDSFIGVSV